jgi:hypothetical protein
MKVEEIKLAFNTNVQFAISDDLKSAVSILDGATSGINKAISNYDTAYKAMQAEATKAKGVVANQMKLINTAELKAKELGINPTSIPGYNEANKSWSTANSSIDKVNEF